jgi:hypothetical protein
MLTKHRVEISGSYDVIPKVRVAAGKVQLLEMEYVWDGVRGTVPEVVIDLASDLAHEKVHLAVVYQSATGERKVVVDSKPIDTSVPPLARVAESADALLEAQGWKRLFMIFQVFVPPGQTGLIDDSNAVAQVFEYVSRPANV